MVLATSSGRPARRTGIWVAAACWNCSNSMPSLWGAETLIHQAATL
jgi:hypothetical protein